MEAPSPPRGVYGGVHGLAELVGEAREQGLDEGALVAEVVIEGAHRTPGPDGHVAHRGVVDALLGDQGLGGVEQQAERPPTSRLARLPDPGEIGDPRALAQPDSPLVPIK
ncbi:MAG: hypothetical protein M5U32_13675 [Myxococcota bacterium]|nr:hypothetical protein [Myxococcota bacterium]